MKTMCPSGFHHNGFVITHSLGHIWFVGIIYHASCAQVHELPQSHCGDNWGGGTLFPWLHIYYGHLAL